VYQMCGLLENISKLAPTGTASSPSEIQWMAGVMIKQGTKRELLKTQPTR